jgi:uncharacterized damage-inducible protein DinB
MFIGEFNEYIDYTRNLAFEAEPDYEYLRSLFRSVMAKNNHIYDNEFDWLKLPQYQNLLKNINSITITQNNYINSEDKKKIEENENVHIMTEHLNNK